jgi:CRISPR-associated protein Csa1
MVVGMALHKTVNSIVLDAKRALYQAGVEGCVDALEQLSPPKLDAESENALPPQDAEELRGQMAAVWAFEQRRIVARVADVIARQPRVGVDALVALALPVVVDQQLDGTFLGLSPHLSSDAFTFAEPMVLDMKFDKPRPFHRLATTGYALVIESLYEYPISIGCVVYPHVQNGRVVVERDFHVISDELRTWFLEARDERARVVEEERDPGLPAECYGDCPFWGVCHPS